MHRQKFRPLVGRNSILEYGNAVGLEYGNAVGLEYGCVVV